MPTKTVELKWEWPAGRQIESKLLVNVQGISKVSKGLFGVRASPSLADALPDATDVSAVVVSGPESLSGKTVSLRLPGMEAEKLRTGGQAALGLVAGNLICVCVAGAPATNPAEVSQWFESWSCPTP